MIARPLIWRGARWSLRVDGRAILVGTALLATSILTVVVSIAVGAFTVAPGDVVLALLGQSDPATQFVVVDLRLPRALTAFLAGAALGVAGAILQELTRNPLVSPEILGISGGASLAASALIVFGSGASGWLLPAAALGGALTAGLVLAALSWRGGVDGMRLVLAGIGLAAFMNAGTSYVLTEGRIFDVAEAYVWLIGTVNGRSWEQVTPLAAALVVLVPLALAQARTLDVLVLGDDVARSVGVSMSRSRAGLLVVAIALTAAAVAAAGPIGFVAFLAPHLARRLLRSPSAGALLVIAAGCGATLVLIADLGARLVFAPTELPVGLVTSILAAPYFLVLLRRAGRIGASG